jgi:hypothetical protein
MKARIFCSILFFCCALSLLPQTAVVKISRWLVLGPAEMFADGEALPAGEESALEYDFLSIARIRPEAGVKTQWNIQRQLNWRPEDPRFTGSAGKQAVYLAVYLESRRWLQTELTVEAAFQVRVYLTARRCPSQHLAGRKRGKTAISLPWPTANTCCWSKGFCPPVRARVINFRPA